MNIKDASRSMVFTSGVFAKQLFSLSAYDPKLLTETEIHNARKQVMLIYLNANLLLNLVTISYHIYSLFEPMPEMVDPNSKSNGNDF